MLADVNMQNHKILAGKFRRYRGSSALSQLVDIKTLLLNVRDFLKFAAGFVQSVFLLLKIKPEAVFSKGGYVALPVGLAAVLLRIPLVTHDSDTTPGLSNRLLRRFAAVKACGFPREGSVFTGNPVRRSVTESPAAVFETSKPVILFMGGSSGAQKINNAVFEGLEDLTSDYFIVHITGRKDYSKAPKDLMDYRAYDFVDEEMGGLIKAADVVVSRAGANAISELAACGKLAVLIPAAHLTAGQQLKNAELLKQKQAAFVLPEERVSTESLMQAIKTVLSTQEQLRSNIKQFYREDAARQLANLIVRRGKISS